MSEFGSGLVLPLVKFTEHFDNNTAMRVYHVNFWHTKLKEDDVKLLQYDKSIKDDVALFKAVELHVHKSYSEAFSSMIEMWANGASDHLYEIEVPLAWRRTKIAKMVKSLQSKGLEMGHGYSRKHKWKIEDMIELGDLTREIALAIDKKIGLKQADMGDY